MQTTAAQRWKAMVEAEHAQTDRLRDQATPHQDHWQGMTISFKSDPRRSGDTLLDRLALEIQPRHTVIDVGAGAGRLALPLALRCLNVAAVEPSPSMAQAFLEEANAHSISNVSLVKAKWEEACVEPADVVLCSHVLYTVLDIDAFIRKMDAHARERVLIVMFWDPPQQRVYPLWPRVHGEERLWLPAVPQLLEVLQEMGIEAEVEELPPASEVNGYDTLDAAWRQLRERLFLEENSTKDRLLKQVLGEFLEERQGGYFLKDSSPMRTILVSWKPSPKE